MVVSRWFNSDLRPLRGNLPEPDLSRESVQLHLIDIGYAHHCKRLAEHDSGIFDASCAPTRLS
jgi:hypothetical protein